MNRVAATWAKCQDEPAWAEYQVIVPKAKTSESTTRVPRADAHAAQDQRDEGRR